MKRIAAVLFLTAFAAAIHAQPNDAQALDQLGRDAIVRGDSDQAAEYLEKAVALKPNNAEYHLHLANAYALGASNAGMFGALPFAKKVKAELDRAVQIDPNLIAARLALLDFVIAAPEMLGGGETAALNEAREIRKRDAIDGHRAFARIHTAAKEPELARKEYVDLVKEQPASARAHYSFGVYLMLNEKNYPSAASELEAALKLDAAYMPAYFQIGHVAALAASNFARGEEALRKYLAYRPKDDEPSLARAHYWLGAIYEKQGKKPEAKASYAASLKINPNQKDVIEAIKRIS
jgi:Tfp pilus assembly protein PilF